MKFEHIKRHETGMAIANNWTHNLSRQNGKNTAYPVKAEIINRNGFKGFANF